MLSWTIVFRMAVRNLRRHSKRSLAALMSLAAGFLAVNFFEGYIADAERIFESSYSQRFMCGDLMIHHQKAFDQTLFFDGEHYIAQPIEANVIQLLKSRPDVTVILPQLQFNGMISNGPVTTPFLGVGVDIEKAKEMRQPLWGWNALAGRPLDANPDAALLGEGMAKLLQCEPDKNQRPIAPGGGYIAKERPFHCPRRDLQLTSVTGSGQMNAVSVEAQGITNAVFGDFDSRFLAVSLTKAQSLVHTSDISLLSIRLTAGANISAVAVELNRSFHEHGWPLIATPWKKHPIGEIYRQSMDFLNILRWFFLAVILTIIALSVFTTQLRLVRERTREIGTLRSLGFLESHIVQIFLAESLCLGVVGCGLGTVLSTLVGAVLNSATILYKIGILSEEVPFRVELGADHFLISFAFLLVLTLISSFFSLYKTLRTPIPTNLAAT